MRALYFAAGAATGALAAFGVSKLLKSYNLSDAGALPIRAEDAAVHVRQIRRYAFAASQDKSPIVGLTHASYALVLLDALEEIAGQELIRKAGYDPKQVRAFITKLQDYHAEKLRSCDSFLSKILSMERSEPGGNLPGFVLAGGAPRGA